MIRFHRPSARCRIRYALAGCAAALATGVARADAASAPAQIASSVNAQASNVLSWVTMLVAVGILAMALVEFLKAVTDARKWYHQQRLTAWLGARHQDALPELLYLAIGTRDHMSVLCGQDLPKMMGQVQAASRVALDYPDQFAKLYAFLVDTDVDKVAPAKTDPDTWKSRAANLRASPGKSAAPAESDAAAAAQARARLANLVARKLDGFQLRTEYWWSRFSQLLAMAASAAVLWLALEMTKLELSHFESFVLAFVGGLLAPFMKDLSKNLSEFKPGAR